MGDWAAVVRSVLDEARRRAGGGSALADALHAAGTGPENGAYSESAVSNWIKGRTRPPADVVLAAAGLFAIPLDQHLGQDDARAAEPGTNELAQMRADIDRLGKLIATTTRTDRPLETKDVQAVYGTRAEAQAAEPLLRVIASAGSIDAMGLSLNGLCQSISDETLIELIEGGLTVRALFLDPESLATKDREAEEGHPPGELSNLTHTNIRALQSIRGRLTPEAVERLQLRTYPGPLRFNLMIADQRRAHVQWYLPASRGIDCPTLVIEASDQHPHGLFPVFDDVFATTWAASGD